MRYDTLTFSRTFAGTKVVESSAATALPTAKPRTEDMREMVDHMARLGLVQRKPAAFQIGDTMVIHPVLLDKLRKEMENRASEFFDNAFYDAMTGRPR